MIPYPISSQTSEEEIQYVFHTTLLCLKNIMKASQLRRHTFVSEVAGEACNFTNKSTPSQVWGLHNIAWSTAKRCEKNLNLLFSCYNWTGNDSNVKSKRS